MMRKRVGSFTLALAMALPLAACGQNTAAAPAPTAAPEVTEETASTADTAALVEAYRNAVSESYAYGIAETLAYDEAYLSNDLGWRTAGSDAEHAAADYIAALENGELSSDEETGALDLAWQLNAGTEFGYYNFSKETNARAHAALLESENPGNVFWATGKGYELADTQDATVSLLEKAENGATDFTAELTAYRAAYARQQELLAETAAAETEAMQALAAQLTA